MIHVKITVNGITEMNRKIDSKVSIIKNLIPVFLGIEKILYASWEKTFEKEGRPAWQPLSLRTQIDRKLKGYQAEHPILQRTGNLKNSVFGKTNESVRVITNRYAEFGVKGIKAVAVNFGSEIKNLPAREFIMLQDEDKTKIMKLFQKALAEAK